MNAIISGNNHSVSILKQPVEYITQDEKNKLKAAVDTWLTQGRTKPTERQKAIAERDKLLIEWLWNTGMRITDALNTHFRDIDMTKENVTFWVKKRKKSHTISLDKSILFEVQRYKEMFFFKSEDFIFGMTKQNAWMQIDHYAEIAGFPPKKRTYTIKNGKNKGKVVVTESHCHPHLLRHGRARQDMMDGIPLPITSYRLAHSSTAITADIYQRVDENIERAFREKKRV
jgi:integrase/recombinase XerD